MFFYFFCNPSTVFRPMAMFSRKEVIGQGLNCDENLQMKNLKETFEEALEDEPNDENVRFDDD